MGGVKSINEATLRDYFNRVHNEPSRLGGLDCVRFVIESIYYGWGIDFRGVLGYHDRRSACDRLRIADGLRQAFSDELGEPISVDDLVPGDIAYFTDGFVGLVMPGYIAVKIRRTIFKTPMQFAACGWHVWDRP